MLAFHTGKQISGCSLCSPNREMLQHACSVRAMHLCEVLQKNTIIHCSDKLWTNCLSLAAPLITLHPRFDSTVQTHLSCCKISLSPRPGHCCAACHTSRCTTLNSSFEARQGLPKVPHVPLEPCTAHSSSNSQASTPCLPYSAAPRLSTIFVHCPSHAWCFCVVAPHTRTFQASLGAT